MNYPTEIQIMKNSIDVENETKNLYDDFSVKLFRKIQCVSNVDQLKDEITNILSSV